jgi:hypothetical protein
MRSKRAYLVANENIVDSNGSRFMSDNTKFYKVITNDQIEAILICCGLDKRKIYDELVSYLPCPPTRMYFNPDTRTIRSLWVFANAVDADDWRISRFTEVAKLVAHTLPGDDDLPELPDSELLAGDEVITDLDDPAVVEHLKMVLIEAPAEPDSPPPDDDVPLKGITNIRNEEWDRQFLARMVNGKMTGGGAGPKLLYMALIGHCGRRNWCIVGNERLATDTSSNIRSVQRWTDELIEGGLVKRSPHQYKNLNRYELPQLKTIDFKKAKQVWRGGRATT